MEEAFPQLTAPPLEEVACGFVFELLEDFDVLDLGVFWDEVRVDYPKKQLLPLLQDNPSLLHFGTPGLRAWLISEDDERLLQLQADRFYVNWRARAGHYPRFSERPGLPGPSLSTLALREFERFTEFALRRTGLPRIILRRIELTKIDILRRGKHWENFEDLSSLVKVANVFGDIKAADPGHLNLRLVENEGDDSTIVTVTMEQNSVRIETRMMLRFAEGADPEMLLGKANRRLNEIFFGLLDRDELARFAEERQ